MEAAFWHQRWQQQQTPFDQRQVNPMLSQYWPQLNLPQSPRVFVPLCGKSVDMLWLLSQGCQVTGAELSEIAVADFFKENQLQPVRKPLAALEQWSCEELSLLCGDLFAIPDQYGSSFDVIYDRAALIALPESMRDGYLQKLHKLLRLGGEMLLITLEHPDDNFSGPPFSVKESEVRARCQSLFSVERLADECLSRESIGFSQRGLLGSTEVVYRLVAQ